MSPKKSKSNRKGKPKTKRRTSKVTKRGNVITSDNDNLSPAMSDLVPEEFEGTDRLLDIVQWNLEWFGARKSSARDEQRLDIVINILEALNGDLFVFQEIAGPSHDGRYPGALDIIAEELSNRGAGDYVVFYADAGGEQRVAMMWDREWLRAKTDVKDLFPRGTHKINRKDAFAQRTPLYGYFSSRLPTGEGGVTKFDFQILGVHLKAMTEGHEQRLHSAKVLADWLTQEAPSVDSDALIMGDWNAPPDDDCWKPFHDLEEAPDGNTVFRDINDPSDFSYLWLRNRSTKYVSRIDLAAMSLASKDKVAGKAAQVVRWKPIQEVIAQAGKMNDRKVKQVMEEIKEVISDHMPVVSRFYIKE